MAGLVSYRYTDGRVKPPPEYVIEISAERVKELLAAGAPIEVVAGHEYLGLPVPVEEPKPEPVEEVAPVGDARDGWPDGYSFKKAGAYVAVFDPDGDPVRSGSPSGKFRGEDAAQEAAWNHKGASE
jgi:hypothetical protein